MKNEKIPLTFENSKYTSNMNIKQEYSHCIVIPFSNNDCAYITCKEDTEATTYT